ncbi:hypothetical protein L596_004581 [Steinernema carpocapsae]|uniref:Uncharacterized protein n=1 Tax=Steinernema carpocapsae TaxID=34508 RepID=A0A4U8UWE9_STECR|nr:hypothetical protein L596_004581 [Steinernema carpocapsae]
MMLRNFRNTFCHSLASKVSIDQLPSSCKRPCVLFVDVDLDPVIRNGVAKSIQRASARRVQHEVVYGENTRQNRYLKWKSPFAEIARDLFLGLL